MWSCGWQSQISQKKYFYSQNLENGPKIGQKQGVLNLLKNVIITFYWICSIICSDIVLCVIKFILCAVFQQKTHIWKNFCSWDMSQSVLSQSDCWIFWINHISRTNKWNSLIFCVLMQIQITQKLIKNFLMGMVRNGCGYSSWDSKVDSNSRVNWWSELIFCMLVQIQES